jgi:hypothetical protein
VQPEYHEYAVFAMSWKVSPMEVRTPEHVRHWEV